MDDTVKYSKVLCIGAGVSGIILAYQLNKRLNCQDFHIYDRNKSPGGVWSVQKYPGIACDIPADLYSFSFAPGNGWSALRPGGDEFEKYIQDVVAQHELLPHMTFQTECESAIWDDDNSEWVVTLRNKETGKCFQHRATVFCSAAGGLVEPKIPDVPGLSTFRGPVVHSSAWDRSMSLDGKNIAVFGNGASGSQMVPKMLPASKSLIHVCRSVPWYLSPTVLPYNSTVRWTLRYVPLARKFLRLFIFTLAELGFRGSDTADGAIRVERREIAIEYIKKTAPEKYHQHLIPDYEVGCRRSVYDAGYLAGLHDPKLTLLRNRNVEVLPDAITYDGGIHPVDVIVLATGYKHTNGVGSLKVIGRDKVVLSEHWEANGGPAAYGTIAVAGFPNLFLIKGPNTATGHTSAILVAENVVELAIKVMAPLVKGTVSQIEVKKEAEDFFTEQVQVTSRKKVWYSGCSSWYIPKEGWNGVLYPWSQIYCWWWALFIRWSDWSLRTSHQHSD